MKYAWKPGSHLSGDAQIVGEAIAALTHQTADAVVAAARAKKSPLHQYIYRESERKAAYARRRDLATYLVRSIVFIERANDPNPPRAFQFVSIERRDEDDGAARRIVVTDADARRNPVWRRQIIARLLTELTTAERELKRFRSSLAKPVGQLRKRVQREVEKSAA